MKGRTLKVALLVFALVATEAACGSSSKPQATPATGAPPPPTSASSNPSAHVPDACSLLAAGEVRAAIGQDAPPNKSPIDDPGSRAPAYSGCSWGQVASEKPLVAVQLSRASGTPTIDYLKMLVGAYPDKGTAVAVGENGKLLPHAFLLGGGGVGQSILFTANGNTVLVGMARGSEAKLQAAAEAVAANLG